MQPHVFVVMPFGVKEALPASPAAEGRPGREAVNVAFDEVYEQLIRPALAGAGCVPFRADKEEGAGDIRTDMYFELVTADVILADISVLNPNVFYELGVRHGAAPRGVLMIHGGWTRRPFDVAPDRTFDYDGKLFTAGAALRDDAWRARVREAAAQLGRTLRAALDVDEQTTGSPVYKELVGLKPVDWSGIQTARAKYFGDVFADWKGRVEVAKLNGWPGDILTLADDAPTRFHRTRLLWQAADALSAMERFDAALPVLRDLLALDPRHRDALTRLGLVLCRLDRVNDAKVHMLGVAEQYRGDTEAQGVLGRVYKDLWRLEWEGLATLEERQRQAVASSSYVASAVRSYDAAARKHFDYYNGVNVVSFVRLLEHLKAATGDEPADCEVRDAADLVVMTRFAAQNALDCAGPEGGQDAVWATATLGELALAEGDGERARRHYRNAANAPSTTYFNVNSMLEQVLLFDLLGFRPDCVGPIRQMLERRRDALQQRAGGPRKSEPRFSKVVVFSGHMTDMPGRPEPRFPEAKAAAVGERVGRQLDAWGVGQGALAICGGARGGDLLFAEAAHARGAEVWLFLPLPECEFLEASVRHPEADWEGRYYALTGGDRVKVFSQAERLKSPPKGVSVYERNNLWMVNTARAEADDPRRLYAVLVWDERPAGDGPGGTSDFAARVRRVGGRLAPVINPMKL